MMKIAYSLLLVSASILISSCAAKKHVDVSQNWVSVAEMEDSQIYVETASIKREGTLMIAREKKVFKTKESKEQYISKIHNKYASLGKEKKAANWDDFSYTIYTSEYDCLNNRFRILSVEDYDSQGVRIVRTTPNRKTITWLNVDEDTVGDYTFFFVCDYDN